MTFSCNRPVPAFCDFKLIELALFFTIFLILITSSRTLLWHTLPTSWSTTKGSVRITMQHVEMLESLGYHFGVSDINCIEKIISCVSCCLFVHTIRLVIFRAVVYRSAQEVKRREKDPFMSNIESTRPVLYLIENKTCRFFSGCLIRLVCERVTQENPARLESI